MNRKKVAIVAGTRPECIKMAPLYFELRESELIEPVFLSTAQHRQMLDQTLAVFGIQPEFDLDLMQPGQTLPSLTGRVIEAVTNWIGEEKPDAVIVQGDTTTVLSSAIAAFYANVPVGHVEAGLRTGNMQSPWPEEMNRRLTSPLARWNFCPTELSRSNLLKEGIPESQCHVTGNTVVDSLLRVRAQLNSKAVSAADVAKRIGISDSFRERFMESTNCQFILVTGHRRESFGGGFENICKAISRIAEDYPNLGVIYPVHLNPQVQEPVNRLLGNHPSITLAKPAAYEDFIWLMDHCKVLLSDSGGVQEEAPTLGKPVLVMRDTTERPEGVDAGTSKLVGTDPDTILAEMHVLLDDDVEYARRSTLRNPYGDGEACARIRRVLEKELCN